MNFFSYINVYDFNSDTSLTRNLVMGCIKNVFENRIDDTHKSGHEVFLGFISLAETINLLTLFSDAVYTYTWNHSDFFSTNHIINTQKGLL